MLQTGHPIDIVSSQSRGRACARGRERIPNRNFRANSGKGTEVRFFQAKKLLFSARSRCQSHVHCSLCAGPEQPWISLPTRRSPTASCHRRLERDETWRRVSAQRSLTLSRLILLPSPPLSAVLVLSLRKYATISGSRVLFAMRRLCARRSPTLEQNDKPEMPGQGN